MGACALTLRSFILPLLAVLLSLRKLLVDINGEQDSAHTWRMEQLGIEGHFQRNKWEMNAHFPFFPMAVGSV